MDTQPLDPEVVTFEESKKRAHRDPEYLRALRYYKKYVKPLVGSYKMYGKAGVAWNHPGKNHANCLVAAPLMEVATKTFIILDTSAFATTRLLLGLYPEAKIVVVESCRKMYNSMVKAKKKLKRNVTIINEKLEEYLRGADLSDVGLIWADCMCTFRKGQDVFEHMFDDIKGVRYVAYTFSRHDTSRDHIYPTLKDYEGDALDIERMVVGGCEEGVDCKVYADHTLYNKNMLFMMFRLEK